MCYTPRGIWRVNSCNQTGCTGVHLDIHTHNIYVYKQDVLGFISTSTHTISMYIYARDVWRVNSCNHILDIHTHYARVVWRVSFDNPTDNVQDVLGFISTSTHIFWGFISTFTHTMCRSCLEDELRCPNRGCAGCIGGSAQHQQTQYAWLHG